MLSKRLGCALLAAMLLLAGSFTARAQNPITIGFGMALTGGLAPNGRAALFAMQIWEKEINAQGGLLGRPVNWCTTMTSQIRLRFPGSTRNCSTSTRST